VTRIKFTKKLKSVKIIIGWELLKEGAVNEFSNPDREEGLPWCYARAKRLEDKSVVQRCKGVKNLPKLCPSYLWMAHNTI
jgi:hypothetical protein